MILQEPASPAAIDAQLQKKKTWEALQPDLKTGDDKVAAYKGIKMLTSSGPVVAASLAGASIS